MNFSKYILIIFFSSCFFIQLSAQRFGIKKAIKRGPDICGIYTSTASRADGPTGYIMAKEAKEWLHKNGYEIVWESGRMEYVQFAKKGNSNSGYTNKYQSLNQLGSCRLDAGSIKEKDLAYHKSLGYKLIAATSNKELKVISRFYSKQMERNPDWQLGHLMYAAVSRKMDPIVMSGQQSAFLKGLFLQRRYAQLGTYFCFKPIDFKEYNATDWDEKTMDFFINSEIIYYSAEFLKANPDLKNDKSVAEDYLQKVSDLELQFYYLNKNSPQRFKGQTVEAWFKYIDHFRNVYRKKDNTGLIVGALLLAGVVAEGGKWLLKEGAEAGAFDSEIDNTSEASIINCNYKLKPTSDYEYTGDEKSKIFEVYCNGSGSYDYKIYRRTQYSMVHGRAGYYRWETGQDRYLGETESAAVKKICACD